MEAWTGMRVLQPGAVKAEIAAQAEEDLVLEAPVQCQPHHHRNQSPLTVVSQQWEEGTGELRLLAGDARRRNFS